MPVNNINNQQSGLGSFEGQYFNMTAFMGYYGILPDPVRLALMQSAAVKENNALLSAFNSEGFYSAVRTFEDRLSGDADNYDGETDITTSGRKTYSQTIITYGRAKGWKELDFTVDITGKTPMEQTMAIQIKEFFSQVEQKTLLSMLYGVLNTTDPNATEFKNNHVIDISGDKTNDKNGRSKSLIGVTTFNSAMQKACGDKSNKFSVLIINSMVATNLENLNLLNFLKYTDSMGIQRDLSMGTINGKLVIIDDSITTFEDTKDPAKPITKYISYILGEGMIEFAKLPVRIPFEIQRNAKVSGGYTEIIGRIRSVILPYGFSYLQGTQTTNSPTNEQLKNGNNWGLVKVKDGTEFIDHRQIPIVQITSLG